MEDRFRCLACGVECSAAAAAQARCRCPECGAELFAAPEAPEGATPTKPGTAMVFFAIFALLVLGGGIFLVWQAGDADRKAGPEDKELALAQIINKALEMNSKTPMMIDNSTRLDRVVVEGKTIISKSTLINLTAANPGREAFKEEIGPFLAGQYCQAKSTRRALELGIKYGHEYYGSDGALLYTATVSIDDC